MPDEINDDEWEDLIDEIFDIIEDEMGKSEEDFDMSEANANNNVPDEKLFNECQAALMKIFAILETDLKSVETADQQTKALTFIGTSLISSNLVSAETMKQRRDLADLLIGNCVESIEHTFDSLNKMTSPTRNSGIILPH